ncbi:MAG: SDR family oxidoreductase [Verrucomicrobiota bacterium]
MENSEGQKVIVIGGITGGIGSELANSLKVAGHTVLGFARGDSEVPDYETVDATDPDALAEYFTEVSSEYGRIDAYVHAIGSIYLKPAHLTPPADFESTILQNLSSAFFALRAVTKIMQKQGSGSCLFFSTAAAQTGLANHEAIAAAKGGIEAMVRSAAATYAPRGLRINAIAPTLTDTPLAKPIIGSEQALAISKRMHPLGEIAHPDQVASLAQWLISDSAQLVTGQTFVLDGGLSTIVPKPRA